MITRVRAAFFSPTEKTKKVALAIYESAKKELFPESCDRSASELIDFSLPGNREKKQFFSSDELVIVALPVYAGRLPNKILPYVHNNLCGDHTPCVAVVTYGNRSYDDALIELKNELTAAGFCVIGAVAAVCEHAFSEQLAAGRPGKTDLTDLSVFGMGIAKHALGYKEAFVPFAEPLSKIKGNNPPGPYYVPKMENGEPAVFLKAKPVVYSYLCDHCGLCANVCPMGSIENDKAAETVGICIKCQACIKTCPRHARAFEDPAFISHVRMLEEHFKQRKINEYFIG